MVLKISHGCLYLEKSLATPRMLEFLDNHKDYVQVESFDNYYIMYGAPSNLFYFLQEAARTFSVELIAH